MKNQVQIERKNNRAGESLQRDLFDAKTALENALWRGAAMLEGLAVLVEYTDKSESPQLSPSAADGLKSIAMELGADMRDRYDNLLQLSRSAEATAA